MKRINIYIYIYIYIYKRRPYYFFKDMFNNKNFYPHLLNINKISLKNTSAVIYDIGYITINIDNKNLLYLIFNNVDGYIRESNGDKYFISASTNKNKKVFKKYAELWNEIKNQVKTKNGEEPSE